MDDLYQPGNILTWKFFFQCKMERCYNKWKSQTSLSNLLRHYMYLWVTWWCFLLNQWKRRKSKLNGQCCVLHVDPLASSDKMQFFFLSTESTLDQFRTEILNFFKIRIYLQMTCTCAKTSKFLLVIVSMQNGNKRTNF